ncbi:MAG: hypothetical protein AAFV53_40135 [Myxococcota bacterium]
MSDPMNDELAAVFREVAAVLQYQGERWFKVRSYVQWADQLETLDRPVTQLSDAELHALPGVGKAIFSKTREYVADKRFNLLDRVRTVDAGIRGLLTAGLAPGAVKKLEDELGITSLETLRQKHADQTLDLSKIPTRQRNEIRAFLNAQ